ncbi:MAG: hypothetical protein R3F13_21050 [Prosthecobacter sp.]
MDRLDQWQWVIWSAPSCKQARLRRNALLQTIADDEVPPRPGRKNRVSAKTGRINTLL